MQGGCLWIHEADREGAARVSRQEPPGGTALVTATGRPVARETRQYARSIGAACWGWSPTPGTRAPLSLATTVRTWDSCRAKHGRDPGLSAPGLETTRTNTLGLQGTRPPVCKNGGHGERTEGSPKKTGRRPQRAATLGRKRDRLRWGHLQIGRGQRRHLGAGGPPKRNHPMAQQTGCLRRDRTEPGRMARTAGRAQTVCWVLRDTPEGQEGRSRETAGVHRQRAPRSRQSLNCRYRALREPRQDTTAGQTAGKLQKVPKGV